jgi:quercetin dioxygenase-like cupin family protein
MSNDLRVRTAGAGAAIEIASGVLERAILPAAGGSELGASLVHVRAGASLPLAPERQDLIFYTLDGRGTVSYGAGEDEALSPGAAGLVVDGQEATITGGPGGLSIVQLSAGAGCDRHAPLGGPARVTHLDLDRRDRATGNRSFQVLFDMYNGSDRATVFVGVVPPGKAPWHFHQYDEIVWILDGHGLYHLAGGIEEFQPGCAFRVRPREVHIVENSGQGDMLLLGAFTPAGSPAAAYLATAPRQ